MISLRRLALSLTFLTWVATPGGTALAAPRLSRPLATAVVQELSVHEELSRPFRVDVKLTVDVEIVALDLLGRPLTVSTPLPGGGSRNFNGLIVRVLNAGPVAETGRTRVELELAPRLSLLGLTQDSRVFEELSVPAIVRQVFAEQGVNDVGWQLTRRYPPREYAVQYRETDLDFVQRLLDEEGIYYYFQHGAERHKLILTDSVETLLPFPGFASIPFVGEPANGGTTAGDAGVSRGDSDPGVTLLEVLHSIRPGVYVHSDVDFRRPRVDLTARAVKRPGHRFDGLEVFDYPGRYRSRRHGARLAQVRLEELQVEHHIARARATSPGLAAGFKFALRGHPLPAFNRTYYVVRALHEIDSSDGYRTEFMCLPLERPFRAPRLTPKPRISGPQTAIVVGPEGAQTNSDEFGRVRVLFNWDRRGQRDGNGSYWARVSERLRHKGRAVGAAAIPRIGQEVLVDFLDGDPSRPIVTGRVASAFPPPPPRPAGTDGD